MDEDLLLLVVATLLFFFGAATLGAAWQREDIDASVVQKAQRLCEPNGGLRSMDYYTATCDNGAEFQL